MASEAVIVLPLCAVVVYLLLSRQYSRNESSPPVAGSAATERRVESNPRPQNNLAGQGRPSAPSVAHPSRRRAKAKGKERATEASPPPQPGPSNIRATSPLLSLRSGRPIPLSPVTSLSSVDSTTPGPPTPRTPRSPTSTSAQDQSVSVGTARNLPQTSKGMKNGVRNVARSTHNAPGPAPAPATPSKAVFQREERTRHTPNKDTGKKETVTINWIPSFGQVALDAPPPDAAKDPKLQAGDLFYHRTPFGMQLWRWTPNPDGSLFWLPVSSGYRREDGRILRVTDKRGDLSWVKDSTYERYKYDN